MNKRTKGDAVRGDEVLGRTLSQLQVNRALENAEKTSEFGLGSELGCNPDDLRVELAGYWSRLLVRVKEQSEVVDGKNLPEEIRP
jgi:hypothetical protein